MQYRSFLPFFLSFSLVFAGSAFAGQVKHPGLHSTLHSYQFQQKIFKSSSSDACAIKKFTLINTHQEMKQVNGEGTDHFTSMAALIDTTSPECVRNYGVVQFIQGCVTNQEYNKETKTLSPKHYGTTRTSREKDIYFDHPVREVDSLNVDPLYASKPSTEHGERQGWYYVSKAALKLQNNREAVLADDYLFQRPGSRVFLEQANNSKSQVYVADLPSQAAFHSDERFPVALISSPSLDFKTCVYDMKDIPRQGEPAGPETAHAEGGPLACFNWSHKFEFNPNKLNFEVVASEGTDPFCLSQPPRRGLNRPTRSLASSENP